MKHIPTKLCSGMFKAAFIIITPNVNNLNGHQLTNRLIKCDYISICLLTIKTKDVPVYSIKWLNHEKSMLSERQHIV